MKLPTLIGHAGQLADLLTLTIAAQPRVKLLFAGPPGIGKTELSRRLAHDLCGGVWGVEEHIGRKATIHHVSRWEEEFATSCLYGNGKKIRIVNEIDTMPKDALDAMLALLDDMPEGRGVIGTTNLKITELPERFRTRFQRYEVRPPDDCEIAGLLEFQEALPPSVAKQIAALSGGNVRAAILDAEAWKNEHAPETPAPRPLQTSLAALGF
jgi:DNA polymerase III delta prime subunit